MTLRVGIDVGGTFTDVVAVDAATRRLVASVKVPTTHDHPDGVAAGIVAGLERLLAENAIDPASIAFIAHSTTQATNALLEGDLAPVGVVRIGGPFARRAMRFRPLALGDAVAFAPRFYDAPRGGDLDALLARLRADGIEAVAASEAFAVDRPQREAAIVSGARAAGLAATSGADVSTMYGLRARTRTAAINAAILPRMLRTSRVTKAAVEHARIPAPLMIMRSDGGVMDVGEVERRPILTLLSGPAAGIAGALFHENVTDAIFIEVGGTSADCSVIRRGRPQVRPARIGGHRTLLQTLDVRTLGIAGGSLVHLNAHGVARVGPRSAHIAGLRYAAFAPRELVMTCEPSLADGIAALIAPDGTRIALTPTCAANALGLVPAGAFARGDTAAAQLAFSRVAFALGLAGDVLARQVLERATDVLRPAIDDLIAEYELDRATVMLVGGGGGAAALVPFAAERLGFTARLARDAEVISPLGVALALVRDVVERTIVEPTPDDLVRIRREAFDAAVAAGAAPDRIDVAIEIDRARNRVRATASGATALVEGAMSAAHAAPDECRAAAALHLHAEAADAGRAGDFALYRGGDAVAIVDDRAVVRALVPGARALAGTAVTVEALLRAAFDDFTRYGDVGRALPDVRLVQGARITDLGGVADVEQALALAREELAGAAGDAALALVVAPRRA
jgi:N-methylhydantoinase A/oxoprolinase/acetone carboxylase beta subunit